MELRTPVCRAIHDLALVVGHPPRSSMESQVTHSTFQLASIVVTVRDDINVLFRDSHGARVAIIEDTLNSSYYRIGLAECFHRFTENIFWKTPLNDS